MIATVIQPKTNEELRVELTGARQQLNDALCVLIGMGITRRKCKLCARRCVNDGYCCWACGEDDSVLDDD